MATFAFSEDLPSHSIVPPAVTLGRNLVASSYSPAVWCFPSSSTSAAAASAPGTTPPALMNLPHLCSKAHGTAYGWKLLQILPTTQVSTKAIDLLNNQNRVETIRGFDVDDRERRNLEQKPQIAFEVGAEVKGAGLKVNRGPDEDSVFKAC
ncbi:hypothetical protein CCACVL1_10926 [Corchorus capsularis]|uniref:Uncharacterized protein n=1 Tax=Corchorus capsularis TaxID=210143 RepID=A0A1R3INX2_COCAP|nr:hypothetical protein CCACVL1_10926 [Corchorus capsularis]